MNRRRQYYVNCVKSAVLEIKLYKIDLTCHMTEAVRWDEDIIKIAVKSWWVEQNVLEKDTWSADG